MSYWNFVTRVGRRYFFSQQAVLTWITVISLYILIFHHQQLGRLLNDWTLRFWGTVLGNRGPIPSARRSASGARDVINEKTKASWELRKGNIGLYAIQGRRQHMEDRFNVIDDLEHTGSGTSIYGIFDGHGGEFAAQFVEKTLFKTIMVRLLRSAVNGSKNDYGAILAEEIQYVDRQLLSVEKMTNEVSGTTALVALLKDNILTVANVGDSRGVMCTGDGKAMPLSFDHKPHQLKERKRIKDAGGFVSFNGVWRVAGVLATSRALGDYPLKEKKFITAEPDVFTFNFTEIKPLFMILASDGLWDAFSNEEAIDFVKERLNEPHYGAKSLVLQAFYRGSLDNITVMVVKFDSSSVSPPPRQESTA